MALNIAAFTGRLAADPELRHTQSDTSVTSFAIAVDRNYCKKGDERQTDWIDCVAWRGTAEFICKYFRKGQMIAVDGSIQTRVYEDKNGNNRKAVELVISNVNFCGSRKDNGIDIPGPEDDAAAPPSPAAGTPEKSDFVEIDGDDDLPF